MHLWRCDNPEAPELHTDPETEARAYDRLSRQEKISGYLSWGILALFAGAHRLQPYMFLGETYLAHLVGTWLPMWYLAAVVSFFGTSIFMARWQTYVLRRTLRTMRAGVEVPRTAALPAGLRADTRTGPAVGVLCHRPMVPRGPHQPPDISADGGRFRTGALCGGVPERGSLGHPQENWLTSEQWWTIEDYTEGRRYYRYSEARYYRLRFPWLADDLADSLLVEYGGRIRPHGDRIPRPGRGLVTGEAVNGDQYLLFRLGDQVWSVEAETNAPLAELLPQYAAVLADFQQKKGGGAKGSGPP